MAVHRAVNRLPYRTDADRYGRAEWWAEIDAAGGDCEDFALAKRARLRALGWPAERLNLATCWLPSGEYHAVLLASDADGQDWVLCNTRPAPERWQSYQCRWWSRTVGGSLRDWRLVHGHQGATSPTPPPHTTEPATRRAFS